MLHLEGNNNTPYTNHFGGQYRTWMRVGTFMRENSDVMYVGLKQEAGTNRSDAVVNWSDEFIQNQRVRSLIRSKHLLSRLNIIKTD